MRRSTRLVPLFALGFGLALVLLVPTAAPAEEADGAQISLPRLGTLGQAPTGPEVIEVRVAADGALTVDGKGPLGLAGLDRELTAATADPRWREPDGTCTRVLLVNADERVPWRVAQWVMMAAAAPRVTIHRVFFGARAQTGDEAGAIGWHLPRDRGLGRRTATVPLYPIQAIARPDHPGPSDPEAMFPHLASTLEAAGGAEKAQFQIRTPPPFGQGVPTGFVLGIVDVLARAGAASLSFEGAAPPLVRGTDASEDLKALRETVAELRKTAAVPCIRLGKNEPLGTVPEGTEVPAAEGLLPRLHGIGETAGVPSEERAWPDLGNGAIGLGGGAGGAFGGRGRERSDAEWRSPTQTAIIDALAWLAAHQAPDGRWPSASFGLWCKGEKVEDGPDGRGLDRYDVGTTGLTLLAFLGSGYTSRGKHIYQQTIERGFRYLLEVQDEEGCFGARTDQHFIYNHAIAALAMVEHYGMRGRGPWQESARKGIDFILQAQNPHSGWRYGVRPGDTDTSVTVWTTAVLYAAKIVNDAATARGREAPFAVDEKALDGVRAWLDRMTDPQNGRTGYIQRGGSVARTQALIDRFPADKSEAMTAAGLVLRWYLGEEPRGSAIAQRGVKLLERCSPVWNPADGSIDMYYWYLGSLAMHQLGGGLTHRWRRDLVKAITRHQRGDGTVCTYKGSWDPIGPWGMEGGRVYATAILTLALQAPDRYAAPAGR